MGSRLERFLALGLVALVVAFVLLAGPGGQAEGGDRRPSTFHSGDRGTLALFLALEELGVPSGRRQTAFAGSDPLRGPLVMLAPMNQVEAGDLKALLAWIEGGGTLLYVAGDQEPLLDSLGLAITRADGGDDDDWGDGPEAVSALPRPHPWTKGVPPVEEVSWAFADSSRFLATARPLLVSPAGRTVAAVGPKGKGTVVALADVDPFRNESLRASGAAVLFARAAKALTPRGGRVWFDEYHQGYRAGGGTPSATGRFLRGHPLGQAAFQLALAGAVLLLLYARRFGAPLPAPPVRRRSPLEHVEALAGAYRQAGARRTARRLLVAGLARRLGRRPPRDGREEREMLERLGAHPTGGRAAAPLAEEMKKGEAADLAALTRTMDRLLEEVRKP